MMGRLGRKLARERGRTPAVLVGALTMPLVGATRAGDVLAVSLVRPR